jgi:hypothetical protein
LRHFEEDLATTAGIRVSRPGTGQETGFGGGDGEVDVLGCWGRKRGGKKKQEVRDGKTRTGTRMMKEHTGAKDNTQEWKTQSEEM